MATVIPGKVFVEGELITIAKLNQLGSPTVEDDPIDEAEVRRLVPNVNRNVLINGNFDLWQRGGYSGAGTYGLPTSLGATGANAYGPDRWYLGTPSGSSKRAITQQTFTTGQTDVPNEPTYFMRWNETVAETGSYRPILSQLIEDVRTLAGKSVVVTWWMKGTYSGNVTCQMYQHMGGSPGVSVTVAATSGGTATLVSGAAWAQFTAKFDLPTLAGQSLSTDNNLGLQFLLPDNVGFQIDFAQIQLEEGTEATVYETLSFLQEKIRCERYFEYHGGVAWDDITHGSPCYYFATRKRVAPTLTLIAGYTGTMTAANFSTILDVGYYQDTANSAISAFFIACDSEF